MQNLEEYARELVNVSISDDDDNPHTPTRFSTNGLPSIQEKLSPISVLKKSSLKPTSRNKSVKKSAKKQVTIPKTARQKTLQLKQAAEDQKKQMEQLEEQCESLKMDKKVLKQEKQEQLIYLNQMKAKLDSCLMNEKKLQQQLSEQMDVTRSALKQASEAQINLEQSKTTYFQTLQIEDQSKKLYQEELEHQSKQKIDLSVKQAIQDTQRTYEHKIQQMSKEVESLRLENIELHRRLMTADSSRKHIYVQGEIENLKQKYNLSKS